MIESIYEELFQQIREKCEQEHWYSGDLLSPKNLWVSEQDTRRFDFAFPPASIEQIRLAEAELGFALPPLLSKLYIHLANGGFGPGAGLRGIVTGYSDYDYDNTLVACYQAYSKNGCISLNKAVALYRQDDQKREILSLPYTIWPCQLLLLCDLGCTQQICVNPQEQLFLVAPSQHEDFYQLVQLPWALVEWLQRWVHNESLLPVFEEAA